MIDFSAVVFDIDGTLLNSKGQMLSSTLSVLHKCNQEGIVCYVATARPKRLVFRPFEIPKHKISYLGHVGVFYNGAVALDESFSFYRHWPIPSNIVHSITGEFMNNLPGLNIAIQNEDKFHSFWQSMDDNSVASWGFARDELLPFSQAREHSCSKIVIWHKTEDLTELYNKLCFRYNKQVNVFITDSQRWIQITDQKATKENALLELLSIRNISPEKVVVFGDDMPDIGMFRTFGFSIAMGNAPAGLKKEATFVTRTNDNDGIAYAFQHLL
ncbi:MAG: HAD-IIB family hydrolase [Candidatus Hermodarchaeota archaeon]